MAEAIKNQQAPQQQKKKTSGLMKFFIAIIIIFVIIPLLLAGLVFALLIVGLCLVISNVIRTSDVLAKVLFGKVVSKG